MSDAAGRPPASTPPTILRRIHPPRRRRRRRHLAVSTLRYARAPSVQTRETHFRLSGRPGLTAQLGPGEHPCAMLGIGLLLTRTFAALASNEIERDMSTATAPAPVSS